jgi:bacteriocin-like protein
MGLEGQTQSNMKTLTDNEMQHVGGGDGPVDSMPLPPINPSTGLAQIQLLWLMNSLAQQQAAYLRWLPRPPA